MSIPECGRYSIINAILVSLGVEKCVCVVREVLDTATYEIALSYTWEFWTRQGSATVSREGEKDLASTIEASIGVALKRAQQDPMPRRRRLP